MTAAHKLATYDDLLRLGDDVRAEILGGQVSLLPAPRPRHANVQRALGRFLGGPFHDDDGFGGPGGWWIFIEVDLQLTQHDIVRPDLSGWRRERLAHPDTRPMTVVPDWVCEIASPSTASRDRVLKRRLYAQAGVRHYWIIDPVARSLEALELTLELNLEPNGARWLETGVYGDEDVARIAPFEAVELAVGRLFLPKEPLSADDL